MSEATATLKIKTVMESGDIISNLNQIQNRLKSLKMPKDLTDKTEAGFREIANLAKEYQEILNKPKKSQADLNKLDQLSAKMKTAMNEYEKMIRGFDFSAIKTEDIDDSQIKEYQQELEKTQTKMASLAKKGMNAFRNLGPDGKDTAEAKKYGAALDDLNASMKKTQARKGKALFKDLTEGLNTGDIEKVIATVAKLDAYTKNAKFKGADELKKVWPQISAAIMESVNATMKADSAFSQTKASAQGIENAINERMAQILLETAKNAGLVADGLNEANHAAAAYNNSMSAAANRQTEMQMQVQNLQSQIKNYFGLDEIFRSIGRIAKEAMDTVKELDAAMTETAVVTNFSVSDMWDMLPTYTKNANALGSTIADVYNAATLYYQQGLTTSQSMALANETLKMARIGGIEAAEATDMMTAALRGFNMEINQASAQKINDVYSKLAAITAADTKEIGSAMERTASIASSANMDFETTSAFLSQMIETTREAPENLGTAMKTIIARFQEMKVDPNSLVDSEGEAMDFNRVDKALKTIGVSLTNSEGQFRDLDDVFIEISSRWDGLTQAQQRYIATIAAGSRQQSRFIAMMQDYDRTMELVEAAQTSEGAGQAQFEKTLESMSSKLNRLKNAWDQFAMGLMNADFLKKGVDVATKFLDIFEKVITAISQIGIVDPFKGVIKSALTATAVFGGLLGMSKLLMAGVGKFAGIVLGEEAEDLQGVVGATVRNQKYGKNEEQRNRKATQQQRIKELKEAGKEEAKIRRDIQLESMRNNAGTLGRKATIKTGIQDKKAYKKFVDETTKGIGKGTLTSEQFVKSFENLPKAAKAAIQKQLPDMSGTLRKGFDQAIRSSGKIPPEEIQQVLNIGEAVEREMNEGRMTLQQGMEILEQTAKGHSIEFSSAETLGKQVSPLAQAGSNFDKVGNAAMNAGQSIQMFAANLQGTPLEPFGNALMLVGQGLENIGMLVSSAITGITKFVGSMATAGAASLGFATAEEAAAAGSTMLSLAIRGIGIALKEVFPWLIAISVAIAGIVALYKLFTAEQKAFERQGNAAAQASQDLDTTKQALEAVNNDLEELGNNDSALDNLIKGTTEWNNKLAESNAHIIEMMQNYKTLNEIDQNTGEYKYVKTDENGRMSITKEGQDILKKEYQSAVNLATANNAIQGAMYNNMKDLRSKEYKDNQRIINARSGQYGGVFVDADKYKQATLQNENIKQANEARLENAWKTGIHAAISDKGFTDTSAIENILTDQREDLVSAITLGSKKENKQSYADAMGYEWVKKDTYKDAQGNELEIDYDTVKEMLPELQGLEEAQNRASEVQQGLISAQNSYNEAIKDSGNASLYVTGKQAEANGGLTKGIQEGQASIISDILSSNAEADINAVDAFVNAEKGKKSGLDVFIEQYEEATDENIKTLSQLTGEDVNVKNYSKVLADFEAKLRENADAMFEQQTEAIQGAAGILDASNWGDVDQRYYASVEEQSDNAIKNVLDQMTQSQISMMNETSEAMSDNLNSDIAKSYATTVANLVKEGKGNIATEFQESLNNVDWSSGISSLEGVNKALKKGGDNVKQFGNDWEKNGGKAVATSTALQEVFSSDDFMEIEEDLMKTSKEMGGLDASAIMEAAESSSTLQRYLDATGGSAEGVARAFNLIHDSDLGIDLTDLTPSVVAAANAMEQLSVSAGRADKAIEDLEIKNDTGKYSDAIDSQKEAIEEMINNGEYGNDGVEQVLKQTFGPEKWAEAYGDGKKGIQKLYDEYTGVAEASASDIASLYKKGDSVKDMITEITDHYKVSEEYADILLQKATNVDVSLKRKLEKADLGNMIEAAMTASGMEVYKTNKGDHKKGQIKSGSEGVTSTGELATQALMYGGDNVKKQQKYLTKYAERLGINTEKLSDIFKQGTIKDWINEIADLSTGHIAKFDSKANGQQVNAALYDEWKTRTGATKGSWWQKSTAVEGEKDTYDLKKYVEKAVASGANQQQAMDAAYYVAQKHIKQGKNFEIAGQEITKEDLVDPSTFYAKYQEAIENAQWTQVGETIGSEIVKALQGAHFMESMKESGVLDKKLYDSANDLNGNGISETTIGSVWKEAQENTSNRGLQLDALKTYLSDQRADFKELGSEKQAEAINALVEKLNSLDFSKEEIASAISSATGKEVDKGSITGEKGEFKLDWREINPEGITETVHTSANKGLENLTGSAIINIAEIKTKFGGAASGKNNPNSAFHPTGTMARGSKRGYTISGEPTLTGEEGPEVVWEPKQNSAYIVGEHGPQFAHISKNATVWNAQQTKRIKKNSGSIRSLGTGAKGIHNIGTMALGTGPISGGGSSKGKTGGSSRGLSIGTITIDGILNVTKVDGEPIPVKVKPQFVNEDGGLKSKVSKLFGKKEKDNKQTVSVKAEVKKEDLKLPKGAKIKVKVDVTGTKKVTAAKKAIASLKEENGTKVKVNVNQTGKINTGGISKSLSSAGQVGSQAIQASLISATTIAAPLMGVSILSAIKTAGVNGASSVKTALSSISARVGVTPYLTKTTLTASGSKGEATISLSFFKGLNNHKFGAFAEGKKRKGYGPALTGEEGPEMAWYPREGKAELLGVGGPQFIQNLPKDATIWTADQTKKIMNRKGIPIGSHASGTTPAKMVSSFYTNKSNKGFLEKGKGKSFKYNAKIFNLNQKIEALTIKIDKNLKKIEKSLDKIGIKYSDIKNSTKTQLGDLKKSAAASNRLANIYKSKLSKLNTSKKKTKVEYSSGKKTKKAKVELGKYIKYDKTTGAYVIDNSKLKKVKNTKKRKAIKEAAESKIEDLTSKRDSAKQEYENKMEEMNDLAENISETFYRWKNELTKVYNITKKIEQTESRGSRIDAAQGLAEAISGNAFVSANSQISKFADGISLLEMRLANEQIKLKQQQQNITETKTELKSLISGDAVTRAVTNAQSAYNKASGDEKLVAQKNLDYAKEQKKVWELSKKYMSISTLSNGNYDFTINTSLIDKDHAAGNLSDETYNAVKDYIENIQDTQKSLNDAYSEQTQILTDLYTSLTNLQQQWSDLGHELLDYSETSQQEQIDKLDTLNNSINEGFNKVIDKVRKELERQRQTEENKKTEEDISNKMNRLAMLRADTSGSNAAEIATLEKEIQDATGSYEDSLEDQLLDRMSDQADEASEQRERQIELLKQQLDFSKSSGIMVDQVNQWLADPEKYEAEIKELWLQNQKNLNPQLLTDKALLESKWNEYFTKLKETPKQIDLTENAINNTTEYISNLQTSIEDLATAINTLAGKEGIDLSGNSNSSNSNNTKTTTNTKSSGKEPPKPDFSAQEKAKAAKDAYEAVLHRADGNNKTSYKEIKNVLSKGYAAKKGTATILKDLANTGLTWKQILTALKGNFNKYRLAKTFNSDKFKKAYNEVYGKGAYKKNREYAKKHSEIKAYAYASGGLANYTGPAWLDGTPSKPELVLNASDTRNFMALKDVLEKQPLENAGNVNQTNTGDTNYEININVDSISSDYDVDKVAARVKKIIIQDARSRNVTTVGRKR